MITEPTPNLRKLYIAGPMRGRPGHGFAAFHDAAADLRGLGFEVISPAELHPHADGSEGYRHYLTIDLPALMTCDGIALLHGWAASDGAQTELKVAQTCGLKILFWDDNMHGLIARL